MRTIYIQSLPTEKLGVVVEENKVKEVVIDRPGLISQVGNIYVAKVVNIEKGLQAAFVDFGESKLGFLPGNELPEARKEGHKPIESIITEGQKLLVQVQKDAYGEKGARLTANLTIPGIAMVYLPYGRQVAVSRKLPEERRVQLKQKIEPLLQEEEGAVIRTAAQNYNVDTIYQECVYLREKWQQLEQKSKSLPGPIVIFEDRAVPDQLVRKFPPSSIQGIHVDRSQLANQIRQAYPYVKEVVEWDKHLEQHLPTTFNQLIVDVVDSSVLMQGGIELQIEQTEALTVIDVDTGGYTGKANKNQTVVHANRQAATEIAQQIRLRNISGIIVIDFVDMKYESDQNQVIQSLKKELAKDPVRSEVVGFTKLGLLEMTRKRESYTSAYVLLDQTVKKTHFSYATYAFMLERELLSYQGSQAEAIYIEMHPSVYQAFVKWVNMEQVSQLIHQEVFVKKSKGMASYQIRLAGSDALIQEHLADKNRQGVDKLF
ncbi:ribonuclease E/G [Aquibacillus sediminis]|uniref:ribonuclease E/G n=1 Tax=Aquibacillus sediminis TaxID=2574734 RepID=UPI001108FA25|nr:ribonuclease E/G [Aquibacillus sediminis]